MPILIGGGGKVTLRITAEHADIWHGFGDCRADSPRRAVLDAHCAKVETRPRSNGRAGSWPSREDPSCGDTLVAAEPPAHLGIAGRT
jgi:alkanesulfonate monooxygenase SsuD/methylene tetrahydromethanopterin reductase-like flavin-dependent oxidoreductase (luciferase family)